jgi:hypothetical protein
MRPSGQINPDFAHRGNDERMKRARRPNAA